MSQKVCYYQILGVKMDATSDELKKAYRKLSLQFHPDKNKEENAKEIFQNINEAYECLSNPNERTWYDNHRNQILSNSENPNAKDVERQSFGGIDINLYSTYNCFDGFGDDKQGFYHVFRDLFENIKAQEEKAFYNREEFNNDKYDKLPGFGDSQTDPYLVANFYQKWDNFVSYKNFSWADKYRMDDESRYVKRQIQKENEKERKTERKKYIEKIIEIVAMCQKLDKRFKKYEKLAAQEAERKRQQKQKEEDEKKKLIAEQRKKAKEEEQKRFAEEEAEMLEKQKNKELIQANNQEHYAKIENAQLPDFYCQICDKEYSSQNQLENHNQSKGHKKRAKELFKEVALQEELLLEQKILTKIEQVKIENNEVDEKEIIESIINELYCQDCNKDFGSKNQLENHKQSKAHKKKVKDNQEKAQKIEELKKQDEIVNQERIANGEKPIDFNDDENWEDYDPKKDKADKKKKKKANKKAKKNLESKIDDDSD